MSDDTPRFRLIPGGKLDFSTDHLRSIDTILRDKLQPISRFGWVFNANGGLVSSCGNPVMELTTRVGELAGSLESCQRIVKGFSAPLPPPESVPCPLVAVRIEPLGMLVATCPGTTLPADYETALLAIADELGPIFAAGRGDRIS